MSGFYIGVDGKARKVKGGYIGIDGKARKIKKGYIGVDGVAKLCWTAFDGDPVFANNSWEKIIEACQTGNVPDTWAVGDQKTMTINGTDYVIDIIGKNHDDYADGSGKAPLTFQLHDLWKFQMSMHDSKSNSCGWENSYMRTTRLPNIIKTFPSEIQAAIKEVNKLTSVGGKSSTISTIADKLFLPSEVEIQGRTVYSYSGEGTQYEYYKNGGSTKKKLNDTATIWFTRSPSNQDTSSFCSVSSSGGISAMYANDAYYISFAFCF